MIDWSRVLSVLAILALVGCGVKGDPLPPLQPAELGRGHPMFKRATQGKTLKPQSTSETEKWQETFEDDEEGKKPKERE